MSQDDAQLLHDRFIPLEIETCRFGFIQNYYYYFL